MKYVPLHLHSEYSLLDGSIRAKELCKFAVENDMPAIAVTDHGAMYGTIDFYRTSKEFPGLKFIIGCEFYVLEGDIYDKEDKGTLYHLVLLAKNKTGYANLVKLISEASVHGFYYKPRINHELIEKYHKGLICMSACIQGEVARHMLDGKPDKAREAAEFYKGLFGEDYYIELQDHGLKEQKQTNPELIKLAKDMGLKMVITNDSHYLKKSDADWHDTLLCLQTNASKTDSKRFRFSNDEFYVKTVDELREAFSWMEEEMFNECIQNTVDIAEKCHVVIEMGKSHLPSYEVPANHTVESYLDYLCRQGMKARYDEITPAMEERYKYELGIIEQMGFAAYFLIVWDFINWARENGVPVGPGRGSAAGSIIAYALGITNLDPIKHNLLFERFLNPERISMPDVDIDFCKDRRSEVIEYVTKKYGADHVCQIITFGTLAAKAAIKGVARVYDIPFSVSNTISAMVPTGPNIKIEDALKDGMELKKKCDEDPEIKRLVDEAKNLEGLKFNVGTHAAGVIISHMALDEVMPVRLSKEGIVVSQYPMADIEKLGLLKMDFLGLETLTIINNALKLVKVRHNVDVKINSIPLDDSKTFELLSKGDTDGVFQLESSGMKKLVKDLKPTVFEDLGALVALFRPGPLESGMVVDFVERKHGRQKITYAHPDLEPILKDTYGTIVYQEQIMQIFQTLAGYSLGQADMVRRMMGKKKLDEMAKQKEKFVEGCAKKNMDAKSSTALFEQIEKFAEYCFNRSHSAAYAYVAYQTAYLKAHYPVEYMCAVLSSVADNQDKTQQYISQCKDIGIEILPPDINKSHSAFTPDGKNIRFGLASVKNVGASIIDAVEKERENGDFHSLFDFCTRVEPKCLNKKTLESLIKCGAFSNLEKSRKQLFENIEHIVYQAQKINERKASGQVSLFAGLSENTQDLDIPTFELTGDGSEYSDSEIQQFEKELLGFYVTSHPLESLRAKLPYLTTNNIADIEEMPNDKPLTVCGLLSLVVQKPTRKDPTKFIKTGFIEDLTGKIEFVAFPKTLMQYNSFLNSEAKVIINGKIQRREDQVNIIVDSVKPIENTNLMTLTMKKEFAYEELIYLKEVLHKFIGDDPVIIEANNQRVLLGPNNWVSSSNDLRYQLNQNFREGLEIDIKSLDGVS